MPVGSYTDHDRSGRPYQVLSDHKEQHMLAAVFLEGKSHYWGGAAFVLGIILWLEKPFQAEGVG